MNNNNSPIYLSIEYKDRQTIIVSVNCESIEIKQKFDFMHVCYHSKDTSINLVPFQIILFTLFTKKELNQFTFSILPLDFSSYHGVFNIFRNDLDDL
ncbi:hypothetical protein M0R19_03510 [Candidatus Pacearchaeota archaeon]|nr:hypothetical protein [Candidatus Pacearchaeota archaeon]